MQSAIGKKTGQASPKTRSHLLTICKEKLIDLAKKKNFGNQVLQLVNTTLFQRQNGKGAMLMDMMQKDSVCVLKMSQNSNFC